MVTHWHKYYKKHRPVIKILREGYQTTVELETDIEVYFEDEFDRWSYFRKDEEGTSFEYVKNGDR